MPYRKTHPSHENDRPDNACPAHHLKTYVTYENDCKS